MKRKRISWDGGAVGVSTENNGRSKLEYAGPTERWSIDFVHETMAGGRPLRVLTVVDTWSHQSPVLASGFRLPEETVGQALVRVLGEKSGPQSIPVDHRTEFQSRTWEDLAYRRGVRLDFIRPGTPVENAFTDDCEMSV